MAVSPLGAARLRRRLTVEEAAARARMEIDQVKSLEENCMYRFGSNADALAAALVYATALGISEREARQIAGLPVTSRLVDPWSLRRSMAICAFLAAVGHLVWFGFRPELGSESSAAATPAAASQTPADPTAALPEPWEIQVDVYNGTGAGNAAASMANRVAGLAYQIGKVGNAKRDDYRKTLVYYPPGGQEIAARLGHELGIGTAALPGRRQPQPPRRHRRRLTLAGRRRLSPGEAPLRTPPDDEGERARERVLERRELLLELRRHLLDDRLAHVAPERLLELVALAAVAAVVEMRLGDRVLVLGELTVEEWLEHLLALRAWIGTHVDHQPLSPTLASASSFLRILLPRCRRDMTVPIGMSRICAASW